MSRVAALVLAAGRSTRFHDQGHTKVVAELFGKPLVRHVAEAAVASDADRVIVVTGYWAELVSAALSGLDAYCVPCADYEKGQSQSLRAGLAAAPRDADGVIVLLADMPFVSSTLINHLILAFRKYPEASAIVPTFGGRRGNPVLISRHVFPVLAMIDGDRGAGPLLSQFRNVVELPVSNASIFLDIDNQEELHRLNARRQRPKVRNGFGQIRCDEKT